MKKSLLLFFLLFIGASLSAQQLSKKISIVFDQARLEDALFQLMDQEGVPLLFRNEDIPEKIIHNSFNDYKIETILEYLLDETNLSFQRVDNDIVIKPDLIPDPIIFIISGEIMDQESGESIIGATISIPQLASGTYTNEYGQFSLALPPGEWEIFFSHIGFETQSMLINPEKDTKLKIQLKYSVLLDQLILWDTGKATGRTPIDWDLEKIDLNATQMLPRLAGETDVIRSIHLLPGVQSGPDGIGGIFIRGGNAGHNLIMVDGVPVYNVNHAAGLLSIFNTNVIKTAKLLKGAYPARYEGRLSSVLDIRTRDGNYKKLSGQGDLGLLSGRVLLEGPFKFSKNKASFLIAGRWSFLNQYLQPYIRNYKEERGEEGASTYDFADFNAKFNYQFSDKSKLFLSFYKGEDDYDNFGSRTDDLTLFNPGTNSLIPFRYRQTYDEQVNWGNEVFALRWNTEINPQLFANTTLTYSSLGLNFGYSSADTLSLRRPDSLLNISLDAGYYNSSIRDMGLKVDFDWHPALKHYIRFGAKGSNIMFRPGTLQFDATTSENAGQGVQSNRSIHSTELSVYAENSQQILSNLTFNYGFNLASHFVDRASYFSLQPRLSLNWQTTTYLGFNASFRKTSQFLHLLSSSAIGLPTDLWVPSTKDIHPENAWQGAFGTSIQIQPSWLLRAEVYYKTMENLLNFSEGVSFINNWEENVTSGTGEAYGIDVSLEKKIGRTTGWLSYSYAFTNRQFDKINAGRTFPFQYDRRHDFKMAVIHSLSDKLSLSANFLFGTGTAISLPTESISFQLPGPNSEPVTVLNFGEKNQFRLPAYHRLDIGANYRFNQWGLQHQLYVGLTNAYDQSNPLYYRLRTDLALINNQLVDFKQFVGVELLPILPSFNYSVKF